MSSAVSVDQLDKCLRDKIEVLTGFGTPEEQSKKLTSIFKKYDTNGSGALSSAEFAEALKTLNFLDVNVSALFAKYDIDRTDTIEYKEFSDVFFGVRPPPPASDPESKSIMTLFVKKIADRGGMNGIRTLGRLFRIMDDNGNHSLTPEEMLTGMQDFGLQMTTAQLKTVIDCFDKNRDGTVDFDEFLRGCRPTMSNRRRDLIMLAFNQLDINKEGVVTIEDVAQVYDPSLSPDVKDGRCTAQQALEQFMAQWDGGSKDGQITKDEFLDYYKDVSASIDDDDYFELMIRNAWRISGGTGVSENTANLRVLVTFVDGSQRVVEVQNELGLRKGDKAGLLQRLKAQGLSGIVDVKYN